MPDILKHWRLPRGISLILCRSSSGDWTTNGVRRGWMFFMTTKIEDLVFRAAYVGPYRLTYVRDPLVGKPPSPTVESDEEFFARRLFAGVDLSAASKIEGGIPPENLQYVLDTMPQSAQAYARLVADLPPDFTDPKAKQ